MTRPLVPRLPRPWRPRPVLPSLALARPGRRLCATLAPALGLRTAKAGADRQAPVAAAATTASRSPASPSRPQAITVAAGDSITWTNQDTAPHTVTTTSGPAARSTHRTLSKGQSFTLHLHGARHVHLLLRRAPGHASPGGGDSRTGRTFDIKPRCETVEHRTAPADAFGRSSRHSFRRTWYGIVRARRAVVGTLDGVAFLRILGGSVVVGSSRCVAVVSSAVQLSRCRRRASASSGQCGQRPELSQPGTGPGRAHDGGDSVLSVASGFTAAER